MSIEKMSTVLKHADEHGYGVAAWNVFNYETIAWTIEVAEEERIPVIIALYPGFDKYIPLSTVSSITKDLAAKAKVPVVLHLDHSNSFEVAISGIRYGFPSIMIDASALEFEGNVELTRKVVEAAHAMGVEVEAELGHVGSAAKLEDFENSDYYTSPQQAAQFVEETGVDSLAIAIGSAHGVYVATPHLDLDRLQEINHKIDIPLVLHGGSHIPAEQVQKAVTMGINKINIGTELNQKFYQSVHHIMEETKGNSNMLGCLTHSAKEVKELIRQKMQMLNPNSYRI